MWELDQKEGWVPKKWGFWTLALEKTLESPLDCKEIQPVHPKGNQSWCWSWNSNTLATSSEELSHWKRPWCWERLKAGGEGDDRGWEDWMASPTRRTWVWASSGSWWWTGRSGVRQSEGSQSQTRLSCWTGWRYEGSVVYSWAWMCTSLEAREQRSAGVVSCVLSESQMRMGAVRFKAEKISSEWIIKSLVHCAKELGFYPEGTGNEVRVSDKTEWNLHLERHWGRNMRADWQDLLQRWSLIHSCLMTLMFRSVNFT